jgi:prepilin-type N-terminal cleavage/methylation domain-containing protein
VPHAIFVTRAVPHAIFVTRAVPHATFVARAVPHSQAGFGLVELLVAIALMLVVMAAVFDAVHPAHGAFRTEPEAIDVQQRLRAGVEALSRDLAAAGGGAHHGPQSGPLNDWFAAVLPFRQGRRLAHAPGTFSPDTITVLRVEAGAAQSTIAHALPAQSGAVQVNLVPGCPVGDPVCGFRAGMDVLVYDDAGSYSSFTIATITGSTLNLVHNTRDTPKIYPAAVSRIVEASSRTYFLAADLANDMYRLEQYDGAGGADVPVVDHVAGLAFEYLADPQPPVALKPPGDPLGPWTTYGPRPPASGDNCIFMPGAPLPAPRLPVLNGGAPGLVRLAPAGLTDGPWCPDAADPNRYDADLLRVRAIRVTLRVEAASRSLRGPAGLLFSRGGTASSARAFVPDQEVSFEVAPRNLGTRR